MTEFNKLEKKLTDEKKKLDTENKKSSPDAREIATLKQSIDNLEKKLIAEGKKQISIGNNLDKMSQIEKELQRAGESLAKEEGKHSQQVDLKQKISDQKKKWGEIENGFIKNYDTGIKAENIVDSIGYTQTDGRSLNWQNINYNDKTSWSSSANLKKDMENSITKKTFDEYTVAIKKLMTSNKNIDKIIKNMNSGSVDFSSSANKAFLTKRDNVKNQKENYLYLKRN